MQVRGAKLILKQLEWINQTMVNTQDKNAKALRVSFLIFHYSTSRALHGLIRQEKRG